MSRIPPPRGRTYADRAIALEEALEPLYAQILAEAEAAGWSRAEAAEALLGLALRDSLGREDFDAAQAAIRRARGRLKGS